MFSFIENSYWPLKWEPITTAGLVDNFHFTTGEEKATHVLNVPKVFFYIGNKVNKNLHCEESNVNKCTIKNVLDENIVEDFLKAEDRFMRISRKCSALHSAFEGLRITVAKSLLNYNSVKCFDTELWKMIRSFDLREVFGLNSNIDIGVECLLPSLKCPITVAEKTSFLEGISDHVIQDFVNLNSQTFLPDVIQNEKDVKRDNFVFNCMKISGTVGYIKVVEELCSILREEIKDLMNKEAKLIGDDEYVILSVFILNLACRTNSGGITYEKLTGILSEILDGSTYIIPASSSAEACEIALICTDNDATNRAAIYTEKNNDRTEYSKSYNDDISCNHEYENENNDNYCSNQCIIYIKAHTQYRIIINSDNQRNEFGECNDVTAHSVGGKNQVEFTIDCDYILWLDIKKNMPVIASFLHDIRSFIFGENFKKLEKNAESRSRYILKSLNLLKEECSHTDEIREYTIPEKLCNSELMGRQVIVFRKVMT